jgi:hypothetical protein
METQYHNINFNNKTVKVCQYFSESNTQFKKRLEYIHKLEKKNIDFKEAIRLSKIWYCITYKQCKYDILL